MLSISSQLAGATSGSKYREQVGSCTASQDGAAKRRSGYPRESKASGARLYSLLSGL